MRKHKELLKKGKFSIWIGDFDSEEKLLSYVDDEGFGRDFDFEVKPALGRELRAEPKITSLSELVKGFSYWKSFGSACVERGISLGFPSARCLVVFYTLEYVLSPRTNRFAPLKFIGSFDFYADR